jgi:CheY-like chemotaxis protein
MDGGIVDPLQFVLPNGLNPQFLAIEGERVAGESRANPETDHFSDGSGETDEVEITFDLSDVVSTQDGAPEKAVIRPLVIVDDDGTTLQALSEMLRDSGYEIYTMTSSEDTLILVDSLYRAGRHPALLVDLIMPRMDGSGVLGGIELLELIHNNFRGIPILVMTDYHHSDAEKKVGDMGYSCVMKPHRADCSSSERLRAFLPSLLAELQCLETDAAV